MGMRRIILLLVLAVIALVLSMPASTWATTFTVSNTSDSGEGSLREAIENANTSTGADEITFSEGGRGTITLASTLPEVADSAGLTIDGGGDVTVSGDDSVRVLRVAEGATLSLRNLTVTRGETRSYPEVDNGGGIYNEGTLKVNNSTLSDNHASPYNDGGGIYNEGTLEVNNSTFFGNHAAVNGGGIYNDAGGRATVINSTFSNNASGSGGAGGGIYNEGALEVNNATFYMNFGRSGGGVANLGGGGTSKISNSTFLQNRSSFSSNGASISAVLGPVRVRNTIMAQPFIVNPSGPPANCRGEIADGGYNVEDGNSCAFTQGSGSLSNTDPLLDPDGLQDNGGPTETIALQPESPAVDLVGSGACPPPETDQQGVERPQGAACDSGAFEVEAEESPLPTTKKQCKHSGYEKFGFQNQGQCIRAVKKAH
jgi:fibronectin-binding autotransporter adhesin